MNDEPNEVDRNRAIDAAHALAARQGARRPMGIPIDRLMPEARAAGVLEGGSNG
jgi:hypothetical protein